MSEINARIHSLFQLCLIITADFAKSPAITRLSEPNSRIRERQMKKAIRCMQGIMLLLTLVASGCTQAGENESSAGNLGGINHTSSAINYVKVNGYGGPNISPFGEGGGYCCVMIPDKWYPGLKAHVEWEVDPNPHARLPPLGTDAFRAAYTKHAANYRHYSADAEIPQYDRSCGLTVHFLPCNQIKVTAACAMYGQPSYPIKEPMHMKEPTVCPK